MANVSDDAVIVEAALAASRQLRREGLRYGVASACIGGGRGIAMIS
jgi:acetyl-CoA C-acetyltransferase